MYEQDRTQLKNQMDLLSDAHANLTAQAAKLNVRMAELDSQQPELLKVAYSHPVNRDFTMLLDMLAIQENRIARVRAEVKEIQKNLVIA